MMEENLLLAERLSPKEKVETVILVVEDMLKSITQQSYEVAEVGRRKGWCEVIAQLVTFWLSEIGLSARILKNRSVQTRRKREADYSAANYHQFVVLETGGQSFVIDLSILQFAKQDGYLYLTTTEESLHEKTGQVGEHIVEQLVDQGFIQLTEENARRYLELLSGVKWSDEEGSVLSLLFDVEESNTSRQAKALVSNCSNINFEEKIEKLTQSFRHKMKNIQGLI